MPPIIEFLLWITDWNSVEDEYIGAVSFDGDWWRIITTDERLTGLAKEIETRIINHSMSPVDLREWMFSEVVRLIDGVEIVEIVH